MRPTANFMYSSTRFSVGNTVNSWTLEQYKKSYEEVAERRKTMRLVYRLKWIIVLLTAIVWVPTFAALFAGARASVNLTFLILNLILLLAQIVNAVMAFLMGKKDVGISLLICLAITILFLWVTYLWSWEYTVKALTIGFY